MSYRRATTLRDAWVEQYRALQKDFDERLIRLERAFAEEVRSEAAYVFPEWGHKITRQAANYVEGVDRRGLGFQVIWATGRDSVTIQVDVQGKRQTKVSVRQRTTPQNLVEDAAQMIESLNPSF